MAEIKTLIVEDEPLMAENMKRTLEDISNSSEHHFKIITSLNVDNALYEVQRGIRTTPIELVLIDIGIQPSSDKSILSGEDFGLEVRKYFPQAKVIAFTTQRSNYRLNNVLKTLNPEGLVIKHDINQNRLREAIECVLVDPPFYSKGILKLMRKHISIDFTLDKIDRQMLYQLSRGAKLKHLTEILPLSKSAIELRKRHLKELFGVEDGDDRNLVLRAEELGFI
jgi:two-component system response regulator NreC